MATRSIGRMARFTNMQISVDKSGRTATVLIPGFSFHDFDRTGNVSAWNIQRLFTACRFFAYHTPNTATGVSFLEYDKLTSNCFTFMASTKTNISKLLYEMHLKDTVPKLTVTINLRYVGTSSLNSIAQLTDADTGEVYADNINQVVTVSKETRRPIPLADWWREKYSDDAVTVPNARPLVVPTIAVPSAPHCHVHVHRLPVPYDDIDAYAHTTYTSYIKFCVEAAMDACAHGGVYSRIREDVLHYHVRAMEIAYKSETKAGDELCIATWESDTDPMKLFFDITRDGTMVFQSAIMYHE